MTPAWCTCPSAAGRRTSRGYSDRWPVVIEDSSDRADYRPSATDHRRGASVMSEFVYCLNTSTIRPTPLLEKIRLAGEAGYSAIEPWNDEFTAYLEQGGSLPELKQALADAGLRVVSVIALHGWITSDGAEHARVLDDCRR